jgi:hypothetical protein
MTTGYPGLSSEPNPREISERVNRLNQGKMNAVTTLTLTANAGSTTLTDKRIGGATWIGLMPTTANAAAALATTYVSARGTGTATITHANDANVDKTYGVLLIG